MHERKLHGFMRRILLLSLLSMSSGVTNTYCLLLLCMHVSSNHRSYHHPQPQRRIILDTVSNFISSIKHSLKLGICIEFRSDVFNFLFSGKGEVPESGLGLLYNRIDFDSRYFTEDWWIAYDKLGDGCCIDYPIRMRPSLKYGPKYYSKNSNNVVVEKSRDFTEVLYIMLNKKRC